MPPRNPYAPRPGSARERGRVALRIVLDGQTVCVTEASLVHLHVVAEGRKAVANRLRYACLSHQRVREGEAYTGSGDCLLDVHAKVDHVHHHLRRGLLDGAATRGPYRNPGFPLAHDYGGTERVETLTTGVNVEDVPRRLEAAPRDGVVEPDARTLGHYLAPEDIAQGLRRADDVTLLVRDDEVRGVRLRLRGVREGSRRRGGRVALGYAARRRAER